MEKLACFFLNARSVVDLEKRMVFAEELGYDTVGLPQIAARDPMTTLASVARQTSRIRLGTGIVPIWTRSPIAMAQEAAVIQELSEGRFLMGLGVGHQMLVESWHGQKMTKPVEAMRDYLTIMKGALSEGYVDHQGEVFSASFAFMGYQPSKVPIYIAALGPKMAQLAGELADGVVLWLSSPHHIEDVVIPNIKIGAERAGRSIDDIEIFGCLFAAPSPNRSAARDAVRQQLLTYLQLPFYRAVMDSSGYSADLDEFDRNLLAGNVVEALASLSDALIDEIAATGNADQIAETLHGFVSAGCTMPGVGIVGGYDGYEGVKEGLASIRMASSLVG